ncbi:MAG: flagellar motor switch protein FliN/FliY [Porticoccus sp.]|jgi:flagellar motor switch protein FliN/FliY|uniref:flagellar motor switch protein FliN n=1 Tax=Porticoccus sp. TaxID=2024853 RepID=UPI0005612107|nr:flagellar motor switch protein FliN [Porticoccus sp.]MAZ70626.1 flagellar motor switch protein FliN [Porticoccus sp.]|tara:strand:+ start:56 stop:439 length:384 start_codon:yes stop_codon:yes gene_type:complete
MNDQVDETKPQSPQPSSGTEESVPLKELEAEDSRAVPDGGGEINLDALLDVQVTLSVEIGRSRLPIKDLIALNQGSVVELDREMDEPLDLMVNGTLIARGEVVVVDGQFGLRLVDIVSPSERLKKLK